MNTRTVDKRTRLLEAATVLTHQQGFHQTTLADIAHQAGVALGNVYYYFRTKEALGEAVIDHHVQAHRTRREQWEAGLDPRARILAFVEMSVDDRDVLARSGCPIGTLCAELHKQSGPLARLSSRVFAESLAWLEAQFRALGRGDESPDLALHVLSVMQGAALLAHTFGNPDYVVREAARLESWLAS